jgi:uncharacterized protein
VSDASARPISAATARRLAISRQRLEGPRPGTDAAAIMSVVRDLNCLQLDPISVVAKSHRLVLWSRLGRYDDAAFDRLMWTRERRLFEYWAHAASVVLLEDYPIHRRLMRRYLKGETLRSRRVLEWQGANRRLRRGILLKLRRYGPQPARALQDSADVGWRSGGWTNERNVDQMLDLLHTQGVVMVAGRRNGLKLWDLAERWLPDWTPRERFGERELTRRAAELSLRSLGAATQRHIRDNFTVGRYPGLDAVLASLERAGTIHRIRVDELAGAVSGPWFIHAADLDLLDRIEAGEWEPRTTLLSPFDNLIRDRARLEALFGFDYRIEIYLPRAKRRFGYYVLPILDGDRLIGRVDPQMDRASGRLVVNAVHAEAGARQSTRAGRRIRRALEDLGTFLGGDAVELAGPSPDAWRAGLHPRRVQGMR